MALLLLTACNQKIDSANQKTFITKPECEGTAIPRQYLVRWKTGKFSTVFARDREELIENFVRPNVDDLEFVEQDQKLIISLPIEPQSIASSGSATDWGQDKINAKYAWDRNILGQNIIVAVVDSGVETNHYLLNKNIFINQPERAGQPGVDDDHNGYIDDINGWNFADNSPINNDEVGHGTHVSGIIASQHTSSRSLGVAPAARILPLDFMGTDGGSASDAIESLQYAAQMGAKIINASWGGETCSASLLSAIKDLETSDILFISAAGNSAHNISYYPEFPAAFDLPKQLTVGASTASNYLAAFSNYGPLVDLVAPGSDVYSTYNGNGFQTMSGTSMATPFVSGVAALLWSAKPTASAMEIKNSILSGVIQGFYDVQTRGQLNVPNSLSLLN